MFREKTTFFRNSDILFLALITFYNVMALRKRHTELPAFGFKVQNDRFLPKSEQNQGRLKQMEKSSNKEARDSGLRNDQTHVPSFTVTPRTTNKTSRLLTSRNSPSLSHTSVTVDISVSTFVTYV